MLYRETELRLSSEVQERFRHGDWLEIVGELQHQIAKEHGFIEPGEQSLAVEYIRTARSKFPGEEEMCSIPIYVKYNRARQGELSEGDQVPNIALFDPESPKWIHLTEMNGIQVFLAGSYT